MTSSIVSLISSVASLITMTVGDNLLVKWVSAYHIWYRKYTNKEFQKRVEDEYERISEEWDNLNGD